MFRQQLGRLNLKLRGKNNVIGWDMTPDEARIFFQAQKKKVLTFFGYSSHYEDEKGMLQIAQEVLSGYSPATTLINIGATKAGLGAIYPLAKSMGFTTTGIVTSLALHYPGSISDAVDHICFIADKQWGGNMPNSNELSPTSKAMVACSDILIGIGGGEISRDEMTAGKSQGKPVTFYPAEMSHAWAIRYAKRMGLPPPDSFWGAAHEVFGNQ